MSYHPDDDPALCRVQEDKLLVLYQACRATEHELLMEVIPPFGSVVTDDTLARALDNLYKRGIFSGLVEAAAAGNAYRLERCQFSRMFVIDSLENPHLTHHTVR